MVYSDPDVLRGLPARYPEGNHLEKSRGVCSLLRNGATWVFTKCIQVFNLSLAQN